MVVEKPADGVELAVSGEALDRRDLHSSAWTPSIVQDFTASPFTSTVQAPHDDVAAHGRPDEPKLLAEHEHEQLTRFDLELVAYAIGGQRHSSHRAPFPSTRSRLIRLGSFRQTSLENAANRLATMVEVVSVEVDELERVVSAHNAVRQTTDDRRGPGRLEAPSRGHGVAGRRRGRRGLRCRIGLVGWHLPPQTAIVEAWTLPLRAVAASGPRRPQSPRCWSSERGCVAVQTAVAEDDEVSRAWADRRGFREIGRNSRLVLDLDSIDAPRMEPPAGIEIVTWAERPGIERGLGGGLRRGRADVPGEEDSELPPFEKWLVNDMQDYRIGPRRSSWLWPRTRPSATESCRCRTS